jgi:DNA-binding MarR family transcriptional regulator
MDNAKISAATLARELATSSPRISRAIDRLGIDARQANGRIALTPSQADQVRRALGATPAIPGLSRPEVRALAALHDAPFGLVSARAVARRSALSPTAASRALRSLLQKGLVNHRKEVIAAGHVREVSAWRANRAHSRWASLSATLEGVRPPKPTASAPPPPRVPPQLRHLFWNTAEAQLDTRTGGPYIARRLLRSMDLQGLAWGARALAGADWRAASRARGLNPKVRQLALNLAAESA